MLSVPEYESLWGSAAIVDRSDRAVIRLDGADRRTFLQGLLTNDIQALTPGEACYAALLTPQGRMIADMHVLESGDFLLLDVPGDQASALAGRLDRLVFSEDVTITDASAEFVRLALAGPEAKRALEEARVLDPQSTTYHFTDSAWQVPVVELFVRAEGLQELLRALKEAGAVPVGKDAVEALRIESAVPLFGVDMDADTIPLEAGIEGRAISFTKGCYVGQEVIIRVLHRGHGRVARKLVPLTIDVGAETDLPAAGLPIRHEGRDVGRLTSVAWSPRLQKGVALGYVSRDLAETPATLSFPGGTLTIRTVPARV